MNETLFSRIENERPQLASHVRLLPQIYRGERWFVLADEAHGHFMRLNQRAYAIVGRLDGEITLKDLHALLNRDDQDISEHEIASLTLQLAKNSALVGQLPDDIMSLVGGSSKRRKGSFNPLTIRIPLVDPEHLLIKGLPFARLAFTKTAALLWIALVATAIALGITRIDEISASVNLSLLSPANLFLAWGVFVVMKVVHEFAHAFAVKNWGGEVHEMGITLLVFTPVPYVNASSSWTFRSKYHRALVGGAGILVELAIAAVALLVFLGVEPGIVRNIALNAFLIGSLSTLLVNGNPLLRFDGYYVLQDLLELPNLSTRSSQYLRYLTKRYVLKIEDASSPANLQSERGWLVSYGISAAIYRIFILLVIGLFLGSKYLALGAAVIIWVVVMQILIPLLRGLAYLKREQQLSGRRLSASVRVTALPIIALLALALIPVPRSTLSQGVVWLPEQAQLYIKSNGVISEILVSDGSQVSFDTPLIRLHNPDLTLRRNILAARLKEIDTKRRTQQFSDQTASTVAAEELEAVAAELKSLDEQIAALVVRSPHAGTLVFPNGDELTGRYAKQGELLAYVFSDGEMIVRSVVPQRDIGRIRAGVSNVQIRLAEQLGANLDSLIVRETPSGHSILPSRALSRAGGGVIDTEISDSSTTKTVEKFFHVDVALPPSVAVSGLGGRAFVRFSHPPEPLLMQWQERFRQLILSRLAV